MTTELLTIGVEEARESLLGASAAIAEGWIGELLSDIADAIDTGLIKAGGKRSGFEITDRNLPGHARLLSGGLEARKTRARLLRDIADQVEFADEDTGQDAFEAALSDEIGGAFAVASLRFLISIATLEDGSYD